VILQRHFILGAAVSLMAGCVFGEGGGETSFVVQGDTLIMNGEIYSSTLDDFEDVIADNPQITVLREGVVPGSNDDETMIALSYRVRELGLNTELLSDSEVYSGGSDLFLAGVERRMEEGAIIGVHSWSDGTNDASDFPRSSSEHDMNRTYIEDMLGDDAFYWFTIEAAPAAGMHNMTQNEIATFGLLTQPVLPAGTLQ
jgi:hypothetical protein